MCEPAMSWTTWRHVLLSKLEGRRKHSVESHEIQSWPGYQRGQPDHEFQRLQHHMGRPVAERPLVAVHHPALSIGR